MKFTYPFTYNQTKKTYYLGEFLMADKYLQIAYKMESDLRRMRADGINKLPTEESFCEKYSCSRQTIRAALNVLVEKGLIIKKRGSGSYIADDSTKLHNTIVFITSDRFEYVKPEFISGLKSALKENRFELVCYGTDCSFAKERKALEEAMGLSPAAILIEPSSNIIPNPNIALIEDIRHKGIPVVYLYSSYKETKDCLCIEEDDYQGAIKLVSHLKEKGHKKTCCIFRCDDSRGLARYKGYIEACKEFGISFDEHNAFFITSRDRNKIVKGDNEILHTFINEIDPDCTAVICHNDEIAYRLIQLLERIGISVPKDLAVVSFENSYYSSGPANITSLGHSEKELVNKTTEAVISAIEHKSYCPEPIKWKLHVRNSG